MTRRIASICVVLCSVSLFAQESKSLEQEQASDTPATRELHAKRYLKAVPPSQMIRELVTRSAASRPDTDAAEVERILDHMDMEAVDALSIKTLVDHFTAAELRALADFYGSAEGKSIMKKFGPYMADAMPLIQEQVTMAVEKAQAESR